jgi:serine/threonine protein kinase
VIVGLQEVITSFTKIGEGAFAQVYEAVTNYQSKLALKCFEKKGMEGSEKVKKAYYNELEILKKLDSPYIVAFDYVF